MRQGSCIDFTSYWDSVLSYYFNAQQTLGAGGVDRAGPINELNDATAAGERILPVVMSQASFFKNKIQEVMKDSKKDFLDALCALYSYIGNVNEFFNNAEDRLRIRDRIVMHSSKNLEKLVASKAAMDWYSDLPGRSSGYTSLRFVIQDLLAIIFHDSVTIPFPAEVKSGGFLDSKKKGVDSADSIVKTVGSFVFKPNLYMMPPPACNIFFPDEYASFQFNRNFFQEPTRLTYMPEIPARFGKGGAAVMMPHIYEPPSFHHYMARAKGNYADYENTGATGVTKGYDPGHCDDPELMSSPYRETNNGRKKEGQFLTSEEKMKGIIAARESMMPSTSSFRMSLDEYKDSKREFSQGVAKYLFYKKRFQGRQLQITSHLKLSVVPGFPVLILDDSESDQNVVAYCTSVTHRIYATEGGYTNVQLTYARHVSEQDTTTKNGTTYLIPPWFSEAIFGTWKMPTNTGKAAPEEVVTRGLTHVPGDQLAEFYKSLLGHQGYQPVTSIDKNEGVLVGSVRSLLAEYRKEKAKGVRDVQSYIYKTTTRHYIRMKDAMGFIAAGTTELNPDDAKWLEFTGTPFTRKGKLDEWVVKERGDVIVKYRETLKNQRGFRG